MKLLDIRLVNYKGIKTGTGLNEIYIDLRNCKNNVLLIRGKNGGGKSTLMNAMSPFPDANQVFLDDMTAYKEVTYLMNNTVYHIIFEHAISRGKRSSPKAFIQKMTENGMLELNPTGNITQYKEVLESEFGLDPNFMLLSFLSNDSRGIVEYTPSERMKYAMIGMDEIEVYNNINKKLSKKEATYKSMVSSLTSKIENIGNYESLSANLISIENRLSIIDNNIESLRNKISDANAMIKIHDNDGSIQNSYNKTIAEYNQLMSIINSNTKSMEAIINNNCRFISIDDIDTCDEKYKKFKDISNSISQAIEEKQSTVNKNIIKRDEEYKTLQLKINRLNNIKSEYDLVDIQSNISRLTDTIREYEALFNDIGIRDAISISKDEYVTGINIMRQLKDNIDAIRSYTYSDIIETTINEYIFKKGNIGPEIYAEQEKLNDIINKIDHINDRSNYLSGLIDRLSILDKRPSTCNIDSCEFIKNALEIKQLNPEGELNNLATIKMELENEKVVVEKNIKRLTDIQSVLRNIDILNRTIDNNSIILNKLPNGYIFTNKQEMYRRLLINDTFDDINIILDKVQYANAFEDYKLSKEQLALLQSEIKIYESKNDIIEEISADIERMNKSIDDITSEIQSNRQFISENTDKLNKCLTALKELDLIIPLKRSLDDSTLSINICKEKLSSISDSMEKINVYLSQIENHNRELNRLMAQREPLSKEKDTITFSLKQLEEYKKELQMYMENFNITRTLKRYCSPSKRSIQQLFISIYMGKTIQLTNQLLSKMFNSELELLPCIIEDNKFAIPVYNHASNMTVDDISSCSTSQKTMASMLLGFALMHQASATYNIIKLDEIDFGLDTVNKMAFPYILEAVRQEYGVEQIIMISQSIEMDKGSFDIIQLIPSDETDEELGGNIIFKL